MDAAAYAARSCRHTMWTRWFAGEPSVKIARVRRFPATMECTKLLASFHYLKMASGKSRRLRLRCPFGTNHHHRPVRAEQIG